jgi:hypothetical protein
MRSKSAAFQEGKGQFMGLKRLIMGYFPVFSRVLRVGQGLYSFSEQDYTDLVQQQY